MNEKERCKALKSVRRSLADRLGIDLHQTECTYEGKCKGTCPKCAQEEQILNTALLKKAAIGGIAGAAVLGLTGCAVPFAGGSTAEPDPEVIEVILPNAIDMIVETGEVPEPEPEPMGGMPVPTPEIDELEGDVPNMVPLDNDDEYELDGDMVCIDEVDDDSV